MGLTDLLIYAMLATTADSKKRKDDTFTCQAERVLHRIIDRHALDRSVNGKYSLYTDNHNPITPEKLKTRI